VSHGLFITFEGLDGSGKTTQLRHLAAALAAEGLPVVTLRQPGGTALGDRIRAVLLDSRSEAELGSIAPEAEMALMFADRAQSLREVILPALAQGAIVLCDRYTDSTLAYQGAGHGADRSGLEAVTRFAEGNVRPSRTFLLDVPVEVAAARASARGAVSGWDRFEADEQAFHQRVRDGYLRLAAAEPGRFRVIRGDRDEETVAADIRRDIEPLLGTLRAP